MPQTPQSIRTKLDALTDRLQAQLVAIREDIQATGAGGQPKYTQRQQTKLEAQAAELTQRIFVLETTTAFSIAAVQSVKQPSKEDLDELKAIMLELGESLDAKRDAGDVITFLTGMLPRAEAVAAALRAAVQT